MDSTPAAAEEDLRSSCIDDDADDLADQTLNLLAELERLLPIFVPGTPPPNCMTEVWAEADREARTLDDRLRADFRSTEDARREEWLASLRAGAIWVRVFVPGATHVMLPMRIYDATGNDDNGAHRMLMREEELVAEPLLAVRAREEGLDAVGEPQHCLVVAAQNDGSRTLLWCGREEDTRESAQYYVSIDGPEVRAQLGALARGDVVRFGGHLALVARFRSGSNQIEHWGFQYVPAEAVSVVARSTCCLR